MTPPVKIIPGERYAQLVVIEEVNRIIDKNGSPHRAFSFRCDCGKVVTRKLSVVRRGGVKTCGCRIKTNAGGKTHGMSKTKFYRTWSCMIQRCLNEKNKDYGHYGGRGIKVCEEWKTFNNFMIDMYPSYQRHLSEKGKNKSTLDRVNCNGNYEKDNCRWATQEEQTRNSRSNVYITYKGKTQTISEWSKQTGINKTTLSRRFKKGLPLKKVFAKSLIKKMITYNGLTMSITDWERHFGVNEGIFKHRLSTGLPLNEVFTVIKLKSGPKSKN